MAILMNFYKEVILKIDGQHFCARKSPAEFVAIFGLITLEFAVYFFNSSKKWIQKYKFQKIAKN